MGSAKDPTTGPVVRSLRSLLPDTVRGGRFSVDGRAVVGVAVVALLAVALAAGLFWRSRAAVVEVAPPRTVNAPPVPVPAMPTPAPASGVPAGSESARTVVTAPAADGPRRLLVHVAGQVRRPGVVGLPAGARVADALEAAGGATARADLTAVNLARPVVDGEQVLVVARGESAPAAPPAAGAGGSVPGSAGSTGPAAALDLNAATLDQLEALPGVGPVLAQRIIDWRTEHGGFRGVEELQDVSGIGDRKYADLVSLVRV
jgi:competence protein ComEA